jgi:hypothetical protein
LIWYFGAHWDFFGTLFDSTTVIRSTNSQTRQASCEATGGTWDYRMQRCLYTTSPIIIDTSGDGYALTSADEGVRFDLDADGVAEQVAWTSPDGDEAFLVLDRNNNGRIDDGTELFGEHTPAYADEEEPPASNGFDALKLTEGPSYGASHVDGRIDARDAVFPRLMLWRDANHNGISEPGELQLVTSTALVSIRTDYKTSRRRDKYGNEFRLRAKSQWRKPSGRLVERAVFDVWLRTQ